MSEFAVARTGQKWTAWAGSGWTVDDGALAPAGSAAGVAFRRFDAGETGVEWHRLTLTASDPGPTPGLDVRWLASDDPEPLAASLRALDGPDSTAITALDESGIESVWDLATADAPALARSVDAARVTVESWQSAAVAAVERSVDDWHCVDDADTLLGDASGRYLYVAVALDGDSGSRPRLERLRAFCPRLSYLRYLPAIYRTVDDPFLERLLSVFESFFDGVEREIETVTAYLDPQAVPPASLPWLESWLGIDADERWPTAARRAYLDRAAELTALRGTRRGLVETIELYLRHADTAAERVCCLEPSAFDCIESDRLYQAYTARLDGPRSFLVFVGPFEDERHRAVVESIVDAQSPAHASGTVVPLSPGFDLSGSAVLGWNTRLTGRGAELGETALGSDAVLTATDAQ